MLFQKIQVIGYDNDLKKVEELNNCVDKTNQLDNQKLKSFKSVKLTNRSEEI